MKRRTRSHYADMLDQHGTATIGLTLAAQMVYAAEHGAYEAGDDLRPTALRLKRTYGEELTSDEVRAEMDSVA